MGSGSPVSQGATIPQSATTGPLPVSGSDGTAATTFDAFTPPAPSAPAPSAPVFDAFNPPSSKGSERSPLLLGAGNSPSFPSSGIPGDPFDQPLPPPGPDRPPGRIEIEDVSFQERLARSRAGTGPLFLRVRFVPFGPGEHEEFLRGLGFSGATLARKLGRSGSGSSSGSSSGSRSGSGSSSGSGSGSSSRITIPTGSSSGSSSSSESDATFDAFTPPPDPVFDAFTPPPPSPTGQDELDARPPGNQQPIISPAPRRLAPSGEGFSLPSPFGGTAETVGGIASIADTALGLGLGPAAGIGANVLTQAGQFLNLPESQRGSIDAGEALSSLLPFGLGGDNVETQFAKLTSQDELNAGESIPNIPTGQDELDAGITDDFSDFKNFQGFEGRSDGLIGFGFQDFEGSLPFNPRTAAPGSREEAFLQTINPDFRATGSGAQPLQRINEAAVLPESQIPFFDAFNPPAPDTTFDAFNPDLGGARQIVPDDPVFDAFNPPSNVGEFRPIGPQLQNPVFDAFDPPAPDTTFDAFTPPPPPEFQALSFDPTEADRQVKAANITQAVEAQNPGSLGRERVKSAGQILRERFDRNVREREAGRGGIENLPQLAFNTNPFLRRGANEIGVSDLVLQRAQEQAAQRAAEEAAERQRNLEIQKKAEEAAFAKNEQEQRSTPLPPIREGGSSEQVINALTADGKGGQAINRDLINRVVSNFTRAGRTPSATVGLNIPADSVAQRRADLAEQRRQFERQQAAGGFGASNTGNTGQLEEGNQGTGRGVFLEFLKQLGIGGAAGGLVGLMRKGN